MSDEPTAITCPLCGSDMRRRNGIHGQFYGCTKYPGCRGTRPLSYRPDDDDMGESLNERNARWHREHGDE